MRKNSHLTIPRSPNTSNHTPCNVNCQGNYSAKSSKNASIINKNELKVFWQIRWFLIYLLTAYFILSITAIVTIAITTRNPILSGIPTSRHFVVMRTMRPIINFAFPRQTS